MKFEESFSPIFDSGDSSFASAIQNESGTATKEATIAPINAVVLAGILPKAIIVLSVRPCQALTTRNKNVSKNAALERSRKK
ncbi:hypothetical protein [Xanthomonas euvesicatoria]|uniref:hypothetical protein n=1 Tax=Xanthomonas euvesicatoria TaxID=456327 RepID=UPI0011822C99|nr:hypothetical protein [Xanthomonas euvesicatoria]